MINNVRMSHHTCVCNLSFNVSFLVLPNMVLCNNGSICAHVTTRLKYVSLLVLIVCSFFCPRRPRVFSEKRKYVSMCTNGRVLLTHSEKVGFSTTVFLLLIFLSLSSSISFHCRVDRERPSLFQNIW